MSMSIRDAYPEDPLLREYRYARNLPAGGLLIDGRPALTQLDTSAVARYVLLFVRDPLCGYEDDPATALARRLQDATLIGRSGMFTSWTGRHQGTPVTAIAGGSGGPEVELALMELFEHTHADAFIRVGGSGGMHPRVRVGDLVISSGVVRDEGLTRAYVPTSYPAASNPDIVRALASAAHRQQVPFHVGVTRSTDSDYVQGGRPAAGGYFMPEHTGILDTWIRAGVLNGDRESAAIVTLAALFGRRGGSVCSVADNVATGERFTAGAGHTTATDVALEGVGILAAMDAERDAAGLPIWVPGLGAAT